jgi:hypothetical protein
MSQYRFRTITQFFMVVTLNCYLLQSLVGVYSLSQTRGFSALPNLDSKRIHAAFNNDDSMLHDIGYLLDLFMTPAVFVFAFIQLYAPRLILQTAVSSVKYERQLVGNPHYSPDAPHMDEKIEKDLKSTREMLSCLKLFGIPGADEVTAQIHEELEATDSSEIPAANNCYQQFSQAPLVTFVVFFGQTVVTIFYVLSLINPIIGGTGIMTTAEYGNPINMLTLTLWAGAIALQLVAMVQENALIGSKFVSELGFWIYWHPDFRRCQVPLEVAKGPNKGQQAFTVPSKDISSLAEWTSDWDLRMMMSYSVHAIYQPIILWTIPFVLFLTSGGYLDVVMNAFSIGFIATMDVLSNPVSFANKAGRQNRLRLFDGEPAEPSSATRGSASSAPGAFSGAPTTLPVALTADGSML